MSWLEVSVQVSRENAPLVEQLLENESVLAFPPQRVTRKIRNGMTMLKPRVPTKLTPRMGRMEGLPLIITQSHDLGPARFTNQDGFHAMSLPG